MKLKHLYENYELKKSEYNRQNKEFVLAVDNDDCQIIIRYGDNFVEQSAAYIKDEYVAEVSEHISRLNKIADPRHKTLELINLLEKDYFEGNISPLIHVIDKNYLGYSDWYIPTSKELIEYRKDIVNNIEEDQISGNICIDDIFVLPKTKYRSNSAIGISSYDLKTNDFTDEILANYVYFIFKRKKNETKTPI